MLIPTTSKMERKVLVSPLPPKKKRNSLNRINHTHILSQAHVQLINTYIRYHTLHGLVCRIVGQVS